MQLQPLVHIFHTDSPVDTLLWRSHALQIAVQLVQRSLIHPAAVIADMEQQFVFRLFANNAEMHLFLTVIQPVVGGILDNWLEHQLNNHIVVQFLGNIDIQHEPPRITAAQKLDIVTDIQQLLLHGRSAGQFTGAVAQ
ncbi:hypothetical protein D3C73_1149420 [compost metagenome]